MSKNHNLHEEEEISDIITNITLINTISYNTWYQMVARFVGKYMPTRESKLLFITEDDDNLYMNIERRKIPRTISTALESVRLKMMPKTLKIRTIPGVKI